VEAWLGQGHGDWFWLKRVTGRDPAANRCLQVFEGHYGPVPGAVAWPG
jgi:hypothetical protein